jgi:5'-nucleotidase
MNASGIRAPLITRNGDVTYGALHTIHPFGNSLITMSLTGAEIHEALEKQWNGGTRLVFSAGFSYVWRAAAPPGAKVDPADISLKGRTLDPETTYRVTMNEFLADGGDGFMLFREGRDRVRGMVDIEALERYLVSKAPVSAPRTGRAQKQ